MESESELQSNLETYQAQLKQVEAALMIDDENEELVKLKGDLQEVINLTLDLLSMSKQKTDSSTKPQKRSFQEGGLYDSEEIVEKKEKKTERTNQEPEDVENEDIFGDSSSSTAIAEGSSKNTVVDDDDIDFEAMFNLPKRSTLPETTSYESPKEEESSTKPKDKNKLSREEQEKRREQRRKKLVKKQQRLKEIEDQREREKNNWQQFVKGPSKGKTKLKGIVRKSIFASPEAATGKVGIGTCGIGGKGMTTYENPTQYIYKK